MSLESHKHYSPEFFSGPEVAVDFATPIAANELFGKKLQDAKRLSLTKSPINLFKLKRPGSASLEYGGIVLSKIDGTLLLKFLNAIAPVKSFGKEGILDDWDMPDLEHQKTRLQRHEKALGENWETFEKSREVLMKTLFFDPQLQGQRTAVEFNSLIGMTYKKLGRFAQSALDSASPRELQEVFVSFIKQRRDIRERKWVGKEAVESSRERVSRWNEWRLIDLSEKFIAAGLGSEDPSIQKLVANHCNDTLGDHRKITLEIMDGKVIVQVNKLLRGEVVFTPTSHGKKTWSFRPETAVSANYLIPTIRWEKDRTGERRWILDFLDSPLAANCSQFIDPLPDDIQFDTRRFNPLIGLATIPYFIPSLRKDWPKHQAIRDGEAKAVGKGEGGNFMGPAQVLVLALQRKNDSLITEFFDSAEEHIERHVPL